MHVCVAVSLFGCGYVVICIIRSFARSLTVGWFFGLLVASLCACVVVAFVVVGVFFVLFVCMLLQVLIGSFVDGACMVRIVCSFVRVCSCVCVLFVCLSGLVFFSCC